MVVSIFQHFSVDESILLLFSVDAIIMASKKFPVIDKQVIITFMTQKRTIATV